MYVRSLPLENITCFVPNDLFPNVSRGFDLAVGPTFHTKRTCLLAVKAICKDFCHTFKLEQLPNRITTIISQSTKTHEMSPADLIMNVSHREFLIEMPWLYHRMFVHRFISIACILI